MQRIFYLLLLSFCVSFCSQKPCIDIQENFKTYDEAISRIESVNFPIKQEVNTDKSSWIKHASFYSCNRQTGYFILETKNKSYIFREMPMSVWEGFKNSESFGKFYNSQIRGKYRLTMEK